MGDIVTVKDGYAINRLFPSDLAVRAIGKSLDDAKRMKEQAINLKKEQINMLNSFLASLIIWY